MINKTVIDVECGFLFIYLFNLFIYQLFRHTGLLRGNVYERDSDLMGGATLPGSIEPYVLFSNNDEGSFTSHKNKSVKVLWDGTYCFSSLSEKTIKSNHLQILLPRQHFLLSYFKTLSVGPAGV